MPTTYNESVSDAWSLTEKYETPEDVSDSLALTDSAAVVWPESVSDALSLTDSESETHSTGTSDSLAMTESFDSEAEYSDALADELSLTDVATVWVERHGTSPEACEGDYNDLANFVQHLDVTFSASGEADVTLRAPEFGNTLDLDSSTVVRHTRGGQYSIVQPGWPVLRTMRLTFVGLSNAVRDALTAFLSNTSGKQVTYRDHEGVTWTGVILDGAMDWRSGKGDCTNEISLTFRGAR